MKLAHFLINIMKIQTVFQSLEGKKPPHFLSIITNIHTRLRFLYSTGQSWRDGKGPSQPTQIRKARPQHRELGALLFANSVWVL